MSLAFQQAPATERGALQLLCFPAAGGSSAQFLPWRLWLPEDVSLTAVTLPRPDRGSSAMATTLNAIADTAAATVPLDPDLPVVVLGHSLGALVGLEVARRMAGDDRRLLRHLVAAAAADPRAAHPQRYSGVDDDHLLQLMREQFGGFEGLDVDDPYLRRLILPPLRADLRLLETYRPTDGPPLTIPVTALTGMQDPSTSDQTTTGWRAVTRSSFHAVELPGDHFFATVADERFRWVIRDILTSARPGDDRKCS